MIFWTLFLGCIRPNLTPPIPPSEQTYEVNYAALFDIQSSESLYDRRMVQHDTLNRVLLEPDIFLPRTADSEMDLWIRNLLLSHLGKMGTIILAPPLPETLNYKSPCPQGGCYEQNPTTIFRYVYFRFTKEDIPIVVEAGKDNKIEIFIRSHRNEQSICPKDFQASFEYAEFGATIQRVSDGALIALIHEVRLLPNPTKAPLSIPLPSWKTHNKDFCHLIGKYYMEHEALQPTSDAHQKTAKQVLQSAFSPLIEEQSQKIKQQTENPK